MDAEEIEKRVIGRKVIELIFDGPRWIGIILEGPLVIDADGGEDAPESQSEPQAPKLWRRGKRGG